MRQIELAHLAPLMYGFLDIMIIPFMENGKVWFSKPNTESKLFAFMVQHIITLKTLMTMRATM